MGVHRGGAGARSLLLRDAEREVPSASELAWILLVPCALVALAAVVLLAQPLGDVLVRPSDDPLWPPTWWAARGGPEPLEQARYLLAVGAVPLFAGLVLAGAGRAPRLSPLVVRAGVLAGQLLLAGFVALAVLGQRGDVFVGRPLPPVFGDVTLAVAAALTAVAVLALRRPAVGAWAARVARETPARRRAAFAVATVFAAVWLLEAVTTDRLGEDIGLMNWALTDVFAMLNGRTPLVDYHLLYATLLPYPSALVLAVFGETALVFTTFMTLLSLLSLLAVFAILRRVARSSLLALGLFAPFVALGDVDNTMIMPAQWPMRYGGAYVLAWLTLRHLDGRRPRRAWLLFLAGALIALDNTDFGVAALIATVAAVACVRPPLSRGAAWALARDLAGGVAGAVALVCAGTLLRAGELPDPALLTEWPRIFSSLGLLSLAMPTAGLHLAIYATCAGALVAAAVRLRDGAERDDDALLTSMLAWAGVFGLLAGSYYVGRSDDLKLVSLFSAWAFALVLLTVVCVRALAARGWRSPTVAELLVLFGFAVAVCTVANVSPPWTQVSRLTSATPEPTYRETAKQFVSEWTQRGEAVVITLPEGFRIARELGLRNVSPYVISTAIVTRGQLQNVIDAAKREGVHDVFVPATTVALVGEAQTAPEQVEMLAAAGWRPQATLEPPGMIALSDRP